MPQLDPIAAVIAADPYPFYARLVAERPLYRDEELGMWVASSATAVEAVLSHPRSSCAAGGGADSGRVGRGRRSARRFRNSHG